VRTDMVGVADHRTVALGAAFRRASPYQWRISKKDRELLVRSTRRVQRDRSHLQRARTQRALGDVAKFDEDAYQARFSLLCAEERIDPLDEFTRIRRSGE